MAAAGGLAPIPGVYGPRMGPGVTLMILLGSWSTAMVKERLQQAAQGAALRSNADRHSRTRWEDAGRRLRPHGASRLHGVACSP